LREGCLILFDTLSSPGTYGLSGASNYATLHGLTPHKVFIPLACSISKVVLKEDDESS